MKNLQKSNPTQRENTKRRETLEVRLQEKRLLKPQTKGVLEMLAKMLEVVVDWTICSPALIFPNNLMLS
jgi:hypothetical protein